MTQAGDEVAGDEVAGDEVAGDEVAGDEVAGDEVAGDEVAARAAALGRLRATHFDRVQVIGTLRAAFGQGRLTEDEYDTRVGQASASQTHADLAALVADIPAGSATARPPTAKDVRVCVVVILIAASVLGAVLLWQPGNMLAAMMALAAAATVIVASPITVGLMFDARHQKRSGGQLPGRSR